MELINFLAKIYSSSQPLYTNRNKVKTNMKIESIEIQNFRKLKSCHINLSNKETLFVAVNNSGKNGKKLV